MADSKHTPSAPMTYADAGVDTAKAGHLVQSIPTIAAQTHRPGVMGKIGAFGAFFSIPNHYKNPLLVSGTDGVGTKLLLAHQLNKHDTIGIDLVAMCANDIVCHGAEPLFFLDYYATGALDLAQSQAILTGIAAGCTQAHAALIGGETAEMPGVYDGHDYDLAGFCVGAVEADRVIDGRAVCAGDVLIALPASGPHANGYSLIRQVVAQADLDYDSPFEDSTLGDYLLKPTPLYVKPVLSLIDHLPVHGIANITGGGLFENIPRTLPDDLYAEIDQRTWTWPAIFQWLQDAGNITDHEMASSFNVGIGMVVIIKASDVAPALAHLSALGLDAWQVGTVRQKPSQDAPSVDLING